MEWLIINFVVNATMTTLLRFYIFKGERKPNDYIQFRKLGTCMGMQSKAWMIDYMFFQRIPLFFQ
jgi:hypothetical protein